MSTAHTSDIDDEWPKYAVSIKHHNRTFWVKLDVQKLVTERNIRRINRWIENKMRS